MIKTISLNCPAKVNLSLDVVKRRPDGYHNLETIMHTVNLSDKLTLTMEECTKFSATLHTNNSFIPANDDNLCIKAANAFFAATGKTAKLTIELEKNIPVGAGLGGGSSDAAGTLVGLNKLIGEPLTKDKLCKIAATLGADVPFFIEGGCTLATGIGEILSPLPKLTDVFFVIAKPEYGISTPYVYKNLVLDESTKHPNTKAVIDAIAKNDVFALGKEAMNVLETVVEKEHPEIPQYKNIMKNMGAAYSLMSGSGSSVFGVFDDLTLAQKCAEKLKELTNQVFIA